MAEPLAPDDLLTAALGADVPKIGAILDEARHRVRERAREALGSEFGGLASSAQSTASSPLPRLNAQPIPEPARDRPVSIRLRNGRRVHAVLTPGAARRSDLSAIARASADNHRRAFGALQRQGAAIDSLERSQEELAQKIGRLEKQADDAVLALTENFRRSTRQLKQLEAQGRKVLAQTGHAATAAAGQLQQVRALAVTQQAQNLTNVIGTAQATAYGERGSVLATNNLLLTGNQLLWTFLAPLSQLLGASVDTSIMLGALAPLGSLLTGYAAVGSRLPEHEQERFITGIALFDGSSRMVRVPLRDHIADDLWQKFRDRTDVPVTVTLVDQIRNDARVLLTAEVVGGVLEITFASFRILASIARMRVAWMVDTGADGG